jgi:hypothetical protein
VCYEFLWSHEFDAGEQSGSKRRPSVIILASRTEAGQTSVTVAPITHLEPKYEDRGIEIPIRVKQALGLDNDPSWVILDDSTNLSGQEVICILFQVGHLDNFTMASCLQSSSIKLETQSRLWIRISSALPLVTRKTTEWRCS